MLPSRFNFNRDWGIWISQVVLEKNFSKKTSFSWYIKKNAKSAKDILIIVVAFLTEYCEIPSSFMSEM